MIILLIIGLLGISPAFGFIHSHGGRSDETGCLRGGVYYASGAPVPSEELCEDCVCNDGEVTCTIQKCRAPRYNCRPVGFIKGTCCPLKFECDDEINQLVPEIPYSNSDVKKFRNSPRAKSCISNGQWYRSGESIPVFSPCQTSCACVDGSIACTQEACPSPPPAFLGCTKRQDQSECCPEYDCPSIRNTPETPKCEHKGVSYEDGDYVASSDQCSECYCIDGEVVCAHQECPDPPADNCTPVTSNLQMCCPQKYECVDVPPQETDTTDIHITTEVPAEDKESTTTNAEDPDAVTNSPGVESEVTDKSTDTPVEVNGVTETIKGDEDFTTPKTMSSESDVTTVPTQVEFTTPENIDEQTNSVTDFEQTTISDFDNESTTTKISVETPIVSTTSPTAIDETTLNQNAIGNENVEEALTTIETPVEGTSVDSIIIDETTLDSTTYEPVTDEATTELSTDYSTVTEDEMVTETTTIAFADMCSNNGNLYSDGDPIPPTSQCQESCECKNGTVTCIEYACSPAPPAFLRCVTMEVTDESDECCPKYDCPSVSPGPDSPECVKDGIQYSEGEYVPSADLCTDCYCMYGEILCAVLECSPPVRDSCAPIYEDERACCPQHYECDIEGDIQTTTMYQTEEPEAAADLSLLRFWL